MGRATATLLAVSCTLLAVVSPASTHVSGGDVRGETANNDQIYVSTSSRSYNAQPYQSVYISTPKPLTNRERQELSNDDAQRLEQFYNELPQFNIVQSQSGTTYIKSKNTYTHEITVSSTEPPECEPCSNAIGLDGTDLQTNQVSNQRNGFEFSYAQTSSEDSESKQAERGDIPIDKEVPETTTKVLSFEEANLSFSNLTNILSEEFKNKYGSRPQLGISERAENLNEEAATPKIFKINYSSNNQQTTNQQEQYTFPPLKPFIMEEMKPTNQDIFSVGEDTENQIDLNVKEDETQAAVDEIVVTPTQSSTEATSPNVLLPVEISPPLIEEIKKDENIQLYSKVGEGFEVSYTNNDFMGKTQTNEIGNNLSLKEENAPALALNECDTVTDSKSNEKLDDVIVQNSQLLADIPPPQSTTFEIEAPVVSPSLEFANKNDKPDIFLSSYQRPNYADVRYDAYMDFSAYPNIPMPYDLPVVTQLEVMSSTPLPKEIVQEGNIELNSLVREGFEVSYTNKDFMGHTQTKETGTTLNFKDKNAPVIALNENGCNSNEYCKSNGNVKVSAQNIQLVEEVPTPPRIDTETATPIVTPSLDFEITYDKPDINLNSYQLPNYADVHYNTYMNFAANPTIPLPYDLPVVKQLEVVVSSTPLPNEIVQEGTIELNSLVREGFEVSYTNKDFMENTQRKEIGTNVNLKDKNSPTEILNENLNKVNVQNIPTVEEIPTPPRIDTEIATPIVTPSLEYDIEYDKPDVNFNAYQLPNYVTVRYDANIGYANMGLQSYPNFYLPLDSPIYDQPEIVISSSQPPMMMPIKQVDIPSPPQINIKLDELQSEKMLNATQALTEQQEKEESHLTIDMPPPPPTIDINYVNGQPVILELEEMQKMWNELYGKPDFEMQNGYIVDDKSEAGNEIVPSLDEIPLKESTENKTELQSVFTNSPDKGFSFAYGDDAKDLDGILLENLPQIDILEINENQEQKMPSSHEQDKETPMKDNDKDSYVNMQSDKATYSKPQVNELNGSQNSPSQSEEDIFNNRNGYEVEYGNDKKSNKKDKYYALSSPPQVEIISLGGEFHKNDFFRKPYIDVDYQQQFDYYSSTSATPLHIPAAPIITEEDIKINFPEQHLYLSQPAIEVDQTATVQSDTENEVSANPSVIIVSDQEATDFKETVKPEVILPAPPKIKIETIVAQTEKPTVNLEVPIPPVIPQIVPSVEVSQVKKVVRPMLLLQRLRPVSGYKVKEYSRLVPVTSQRLNLVRLQRPSIRLRGSTISGITAKKQILKAKFLKLFPYLMDCFKTIKSKFLGKI